MKEIYILATESSYGPTFRSFRTVESAINAFFDMVADVADDEDVRRLKEEDSYDWIGEEDRIWIDTCELED